jgi:hypothetical protein
MQYCGTEDLMDKIFIPAKAVGNTGFCKGLNVPSCTAFPIWTSLTLLRYRTSTPRHYLNYVANSHLPQLRVAQIVVSWIYRILPPSTLKKLELGVPSGLVVSMNGKLLKIPTPPIASSIT